MNIYNAKIHTPFSMILAGSSGSGKTTWLEKFLQNFDFLCDGQQYKKLLWFSGSKQPDLFKRLEQQFKGSVRIYTEIPPTIFEDIEKTGKNSIIVIDDLMHEMKADSGIGKLFTKGRSHLNCNVILLWQNVFPQGTEMRNLSINTQYFVIFKNPRDKSQIRFFSQQVAPGKTKVFLDVFNDSTERNYGYLFCDFSQVTPEKIRFRTNILPSEYPMCTYDLRRMGYEKMILLPLDQFEKITGKKENVQQQQQQQVARTVSRREHKRKNNDAVTHLLSTLTKKQLRNFLK